MYKNNHFTPYPEPDPSRDLTEWLRWFYYHYNIPKTNRSYTFRNQSNEKLLNHAGQEQLEHDRQEWNNAEKLPIYE